MRIVVVRGARWSVSHGQRRLLGRGELVPLRHRVSDELILFVGQALVDHRHGFVSTRQIHDPTQVNRRGWDIGDQYRSAIFTHDEEQARIPKESQERTQHGLRKPIATEIAPAATFCRAEDYHQQYLEMRGQASCAIPALANRTSEMASREA